jgi:hypothetical protein
MPKPSWIGQTIGGRYKIEDMLGQGGMSAVYRATDPNLRRTVAIKLIHSHLATDREFVRRFEEEAAAVAGLRHANIVQVFDFNHEEDHYYMVLEFVTGLSLQEKLRALHEAGQRLTISEVVRIMTTLCEAVQYAHERGLIHRDIKPANVMLNSAGQPILMDFGVAKIMGGKNFTATGAVIGTPAYIAPELVRGQRPDVRADIYSLGIILFEMLAGQLPFDADSAMSLMMKHLTEPVPALHDLAPKVPRPLVAVVERALEKDPDARFQTAAELSAALRAALTGASITTQPVRPGDTGLMPVPTPGGRAPAREDSRPTRPARSNTALMLGGAIVLGLCAVGAIAAVAGSFLLNQLGAGTAVAGATATGAPTATGANVAQTITAAAPLPTGTTAPTPTATLLPTDTPTLAPTHTPATLYASINWVRIENARYLVDFQTFNYQSQLPGMHIHLFFDTVPPAQAGSPGFGPWYVHGAGSPVSPYLVSERPPGASKMCILAANPDHSIILNSGNCIDLPQG